MPIFIVREQLDGVLVPLRSIVQRLSFLTVATWCFRQISIYYAQPFGLTVQEFEALTWGNPKGYCVADRDMRIFLDTDFQIIDGEIDAIAEDGSHLVTIICEDSTQWEIHPGSLELVLEMKRLGFESQCD